MPASVLIVDSQPASRQGLRQAIERDGRLAVCGEVPGMVEALRHCDGHCPDLIVVDVGLASGAGIELIKRLRERHVHLRVLAWSSSEDALYAERALRAGAKGYISKDRETAEVVAALCKIGDGGVYLSDKLASRMLNLVSGGFLAPQTPFECLSDRELQVFAHIGEGRTTAEIAQKLHLSAHTIETYRYRIKEKLGLRTAAELSRAAAQWVLQRE